MEWFLSVAVTVQWMLVENDSCLELKVKALAGLIDNGSAFRKQAI